MRGMRPTAPRPLAVAVTLLALLLTGCSLTAQGGMSPSDAPVTPTATAEDTATGSTASPEPVGVGGLRPCDVLDQSDLAALKLTGGTEKTIGTARVCRYRREGATLKVSFTVSVELFDTYALADLNASSVQRLPRIGDHEAVRFTGVGGSCGVSLGVGDSSRVDNTVVGGDGKLACQIAEQLAKVVERKLP
ncbi:MAG TPA: DUF3558 domain-containing protein [Nonomuraea sp.]|nr:DUF3558 domain-containing protein [Nonomuraea sp.]